MPPNKLLDIDKELIDISKGLFGLSDKYLLLWFKASLLFQLTSLFTRRNLLLNYCLNDQAPPQITKIPPILCINILNILYTPRLIHSPCLFRILE